MNRACLLAWVLSTTVTLACSTPAPQSKSTGTNWLACHDDADCARVDGATCGKDLFCVGRDGQRVRADAASERDASTNPGPDAMVSGGGTSPSGGTGGAPASGGAHSDGGARSNGGADGMFDGGMGGAPSDSGAPASGGSDGVLPDGGIAGAIPIRNFPPSSDCYSPGQNLEHAYEPGAKGCKCSDGTASLCVRAGTSPRSTLVALECTGGTWKAVEDGTCGGCWAPNSPEHALADPLNGCFCAPEVEGQTACMYTRASGYFTVACTASHWKVAGATNACPCKYDEACGYQGKCVNEACARPSCEIDNVSYPAGATMPDPFSCNSCTCSETGTAENCTDAFCPTDCPAGTRGGTSCLQCGPGDACSLQRRGCLGACATNDDCPGGHCDSNHVCAGEICL
jgi:hypothetical protein